MLTTAKHINKARDQRYAIALVILALVVVGLVIRLWYLQIQHGDHYRRVAENNRMRKIEIPAPRGLIFDRHGKLLLGNKPAYDLVYTPQYVQDKDAVLASVAALLAVPVASLQRQVDNAASRPKFMPITLHRDLNMHELALFHTNKFFLAGIDVLMSSQRSYRADMPAHLFGHLGKISSDTLQRWQQQHPDKHYQAGDWVGKQGLELGWEHYLRGESGYAVVQVDAFGRRAARKHSHLHHRNAISGANLELTIDLQLQLATTKAFAAKRGAVVVLDPRDGAVLAMLSKPQFNPRIYQQYLPPLRWQALLSNPFHPLLDKTTGGEYSPGSIYKSVVALAALAEGITTPARRINCAGAQKIGDKIFHCHQRRGHGDVDLETAIARSCDIYFYQVGLEIGVDTIARFARKFMLGAKLNLGLNLERAGLVPTRAWKQRRYNSAWTAGETANIAIGQSYTLLTPLQMASLYATIANGGKVWQPYLVRRVIDYYGKTLYQQQPTVIHRTAINPVHLKLLRQYLHSAVKHPQSTGHRAYTEQFSVAGKTGSIQVVSLDKYQGEYDVSTKWHEHAIFIAFSPVENAEIVVAVVSENDTQGGGGVAAAPIAKKILTAYWQR
ncbi:MAG: penicillin-binding protein 2 [Pseudomonadota bacterium]|nr:penicillin-binding protein 2 [Pseudomonadota bacterium]